MSPTAQERTSVCSMTSSHVHSPLLTPAITIEQVESLLKTNDAVPPVPDISKSNAAAAAAAAAPMPPTPTAYDNRTQSAPAANGFNVPNPSIAIANDRDMDRWHFNGESPQAANVEEFNFAGTGNMPGMGMENMSNLPNNFTWEMIGLGLEEPLPPQETIDELYASKILTI